MGNIQEFYMWDPESLSDLNAYDFRQEVKGCVSIKNRGKHELRYLEVYSGFDIETTTTPTHHGFMYHWQLSINDICIYGNKWFQFRQLIGKIKRDLTLRKTTRLIIWIANLSFEFSFMQSHFNITRIFAKEKRKPIIAEIDECIELRDALQITGGSLAQLAKDFCTTQKLKGDLDYDIMRNYIDGEQLTEKEHAYCRNDVVILSEFSEYIFNEYIKKDKYVPITKTGLLRRQVSKGCTRAIKEMVNFCFPDKELYDTMMHKCFRGGFVHANILYAGYKIEDITGIDITSSYPARMLQSYFPVSPFVKQDKKKIDFEKTIDSKCCIMHFKFFGLKSKTPHSIESKSKCLQCINPIIDNGRVSSASMIEVWLTELDYKIYEKFYTWKIAELHDIYTAERGTLPNYLLAPIENAYTKKAELKSQGLSGTAEYALQKSYVNSGYGLTCQKMVTREITFNNGVWGFDDSKFSYDKEVEKAILLPQWGLYVASSARYEILTMIHKLETAYSYRTHGTDKSGCVLYSDTDSIKMLHYDMLKDIIESYNNERTQQMKDICNKKGLPYDIFHDLGSFELEYTGVKGKFLGAKRYIITDSEGDHVTIAGLPKSALPEYCKKTGLDIYDVFEDHMLLDIDVSMKNAHTYVDEPYEEIVNGLTMRELSGCGIFKIPFTLKLAEFYALQINALHDSQAKLEVRNAEYIKDDSERIKEIAQFMIDYQITSIREVAKEFGEPYYKIYRWLSDDLRYIDDEMFNQIQNLRK